MRRREFYKAVGEMAALAGDARVLLDAAEQEMRRVRGMEAQKSALPMDRLGDIYLQDDALGQIYQAINAPALESAYRATARDGRKFTAEQIPAVTQLFTPRWVVEFLLHNSLGKLWKQMHPDTELAGSWSWMVEGEEDNRLPAKRTGDLRICDPACGTMNFGLVAIDMLRQMYGEEIRRAGECGWEAPSCESMDQVDRMIVERNLAGFDIDPVAIELARRSLGIKIGQRIERDRLRVVDALFDGDIEGGFDVVVTNPPYLSARNLDAGLVKRMKRRYPSAWRDAYSCFISRAMELVADGGRAGILCMQSFMFTAAFEKLREEIAGRAVVETAAHFGPGLFEIGNPGTLQTVAMVMRKAAGEDERRGVYFRLVDVEDKREGLRAVIDGGARRFEISGAELARLPRGAWMYWIDGASRRAFTCFAKLGEIAPPRQGLATTDNARFVRYWWEVESAGFSGKRTKWLPYAKGGRFRRWYESARHRVDWEDDGREIKAEIVRRYPYLQGQWQWVAKNSEWYGKPGITYSYLTSGKFSARRLEAGTIFDVAGSSLFPADELGVLGVLNSSCAGRLLAAINPTVNFQVGDLRELPMPGDLTDELRNAVARAIELTRQLDGFDETSADFVEPELWGSGAGREIKGKLAAVEREIDVMVAAAYEMECAVEETIAAVEDEKDLATRWVSYAIGVWLGRWRGEARGRVAELAPMSSRLAEELRGILVERAGAALVAWIESCGGGLERMAGKEFIAWHDRAYRYRPVIWGLGAGGRLAAVSWVGLDGEVLGEAMRHLGVDAPSEWRRTDDGIGRDLLPIVERLADRELQKAVKKLAGARRDAAVSESRT